MECLLKMRYQSLPYGLVRGADWRRVGTMILGAVATSMSLFPSGLLAARAATIELSPMVAKATLISAVDAAKEISVVLTIPLGDSKGAVDFARRVSNPQDPLYRKYITPQEFAARFGANADGICSPQTVGNK